MFDHSILLCLNLFIINRAYGGATNETSNPVVLRSGPILQEFGDDVPRAAAQISIRDCLCQCHWQTFRDRYGKTHGNCKSTHNGAQWCYVRTPVQTYLGNHGHSTCSDLQRSSRYENMVWSYQACVTPYLTSDVCSYLLQNHRETNNDGNYINGIKPRIGENQETVGKFRDPEDGAIKKGNQFIPIDSVITLLGARPEPSKNQDIPKSSVAPLTSTQTTIRESDPIDSNIRTSSESNNIDDDAVVFG